MSDDPRNDIRILRPGTGDRSHDTSNELTEVRTVLSRAGDALETLMRLKAQDYVRGYRDWTVTNPETGQRSTYIEDRTPDPDIDKMIYWLRNVIDMGKHWRRDGRATKAEIADWEARTGRSFR